jgi:phosphatidylserine/phosphatidylglycerophosphate/cardiolipin synthase-like enzyme
LPSTVGKAMGDPGVDTLSVFFLAQGEQSADAVMARLTTFIRAARRSLDFAVYDMRFSDPLKASMSSALRERAEAGVEIRFCYDGDKPLRPNVAAGQDPAPAGTGAFVQSLGYPWRRIAGMKLMRSKFILRDGQSVWTGSTNMTDDAFTLMENNIVEIDSSPLANYYAEEFQSFGKKKTLMTPAGFTRCRCQRPLPVNRPRRASCFLQAAVWKSILRLPGAFARRSGVSVSAVY